MGDYIDKIASRRDKPVAAVVVAPEDGGDGDPPEGSDADLEKEKGDSYEQIEADALDDLAGVLGVSEKDRAEFDGGMKELIEACVKRITNKPKE